MTESVAPAASQRIGIMGGTFDPIHNGHLVAASEVAHRFDLDQVIFVPTGQPWQKAEKKVTAAEHRYIMTTIATASNPRFRVSRVDIDRSGPTYTIDTLRDIASLFPGAQLYFITGADALAGIMSWRDWDAMLDMAHFVGVTRPGYELTKDMVPADAQEAIDLVEIPAMAISSTDCRARAQEGAPVWYLVPDGVVQYMAKNKLYQPDENRVLDLN
ncbi:nicotinate-nucleotide adenylyltransferase [uncultured Corynebacterium sp.]|uniref:nicotinate-nucleotide adenylyltransferase n=1 Tax=uncultured Corynebacterium sp. TaxID=159447 RepID=UPI0025E54C91|nr:nicotinate-nucleotide adenylyltransferase [uncultured Corynebacterium sp.]